MNISKHALSSRFARRLLAAQGAYYAASGIWPLVHRSSFERMTGPKTDFWLVRTVGSLIAVMGGVLMWAATREDPGVETAALAVGGAAALGAVDSVYASRGRISRVYWLDAAAEVGLAACWMAALTRQRGPVFEAPEGPPEILVSE